MKRKATRLSCAAPCGAPSPGKQQVLTKPCLWVPQPLDYETRPARSLIIAVENEELLFPGEGARSRGRGGGGGGQHHCERAGDGRQRPARLSPPELCRRRGRWRRAWNSAGSFQCCRSRQGGRPGKVRREEWGGGSFQRNQPGVRGRSCWTPALWRVGEVDATVTKTPEATRRRPTGPRSEPPSFCTCL